MICTIMQMDCNIMINFILIDPLTLVEGVRPLIYEEKSTHRHPKQLIGGSKRFLFLGEAI